MPRGSLKAPDGAAGLELKPESLPQDPSGGVAWAQVFGAERPLRVEIGVGNSPFLIELSRQSPGFNYVGFEYSAKRVVKFLKRVVASEVTNVRILRVNAASILTRIFRPGTIDHFYLNHPDPWPKRRHWKKRFIVPENARILRDLLRPGGGISLRTDFRGYAEHMLRVLDGTEGLAGTSGRGAFAPAPREPFRTPFEEKFLHAGSRIFYLEYVKA